MERFGLRPMVLRHSPTGHHVDVTTSSARQRSRVRRTRLDWEGDVPPT
jgi:hypothetical protein